ncbi:MAG: dephospho-CoA kinase [Oscillospiraceae bacterium]|nr:dephospho-CoA kinase [Oscillospiraceae bacterium]
MNKMSVLPNISITGLTGISGAGKSTVAKIFAERGFTVIDCDMLARKTAQDTRFLSELSQRFEKDLFNSDGTLDREKTAQVVFSDKEKNAKYLGVIFPYITYEIMQFIHCVQGEILLDAPTLFEAKIDMLCDNVISVIADEEVCIKRISFRDSISETQARARLFAQHSENFFRNNSDFVIENNSEDNYETLSADLDRIIKDIRNG